MGTVIYGCGCSISTSMFGERQYMWVNVCFFHSLDDVVHKAGKHLLEVAGSMEPVNYSDPETQKALAALAKRVLELQDLDTHE